MLPKFVDHPVGGYRVVVDYANRLARRGHRPTIVLPVTGSWNALSPRPGYAEVRQNVFEARQSRMGIPWAELEPNVQVKPVLAGVPWAMPAGDVIIATAWLTAGTVSAAPLKCGAKLYFIQHYETAWAAGDPDVVRRTWQLPMHKGVIAKWLLELAEEFGEAERTAYVPNGIDLDRFCVTTPIAERGPRRVGMLLHRAEWKGTDIGLAALDLARRDIPDLEVEVYGASGYEGELPGWITDAGALSGEQVPEYFNRQAIFVHPSLTEGWGLPPAEAMACGVAAVCADNQGVMDYAVDGLNASVVPRGSAEPLAAAIVALARDPARRIALAERGHDSIQDYGVEAATDRFEALLQDLASA